MPLYDYKCVTHGVFHELATIADSGNPGVCPQCGKLSGRVIMVAPELLAMKQQNREAHVRNEKATHEPILSTAEYRAEQQVRREHKQGRNCGCGHKPIRKSNLLFTADGKKMFPSMRPWMISH